MAQGMLLLMVVPPETDANVSTYNTILETRQLISGNREWQNLINLRIFDVHCLLTSDRDRSI